MFNTLSIITSPPKAGLRRQCNRSLNLLGFHRNDLQEITSAPGYGDRKASFITDALSMILGHELGHILLHHKGYKGINPEEAREQELAADKFGTNWRKKPDFNLWPLFSRCSWFSQPWKVERSLPTPALPAALCRISVLMQNELERMEAEPTAAASLKRIGMTMKQFKESVSQLEDADLNAICCATSESSARTWASWYPHARSGPLVLSEASQKAVDAPIIGPLKNVGF